MQSLSKVFDSAKMEGALPSGSVPLFPPRGVAGGGHIRTSPGAGSYG